MIVFIHRLTNVEILWSPTPNFQKILASDPISYQLFLRVNPWIGSYQLGIHSTL